MFVSLLSHPIRRLAMHLSAPLALVLAVAIAALSAQSATAAPSPQPIPFQNGVGGGPSPVGRPDNQRHGEVHVGAQRDRGVGTSVHVQGRGDAWVSRDGNSRVTVDGRYGQVVHGPMRGQRDYGANVQFQNRF